MLTGVVSNERRRADGLRRGLGRVAARVAALATLLGAVLAFAAGSASAAIHWGVDLRHGPEHMMPGEPAQYVVELQNLGDEMGIGASVRLRLPEGVVAREARPTVFGPLWACDATGGGGLAGATDVTCNYAFPVMPTNLGSSDESGFAFMLYLTVDVRPDAAIGVRNTVIEVSSPGATLPGGTTACGGVGEPMCAVDIDRTTFATSSAGFGVSDGNFRADYYDAAGPLGQPVRQAGSHPFEARFGIDFNLAATRDIAGRFFTEPDEHVRTLELKLPKGLIGDPQATPKCPMAQLVLQSGGSSLQGSCPPGSQIGVAEVTLQNGADILIQDLPNAYKNLGVYNIEPPRGTVAAFGMSVIERPIIIRAELDPADNYAIKTTIHSMVSAIPVRNVKMTMWGVPADPAHDYYRRDPLVNGGARGAKNHELPKPFLTLPSHCSTPTQATMRAESWQTRGRFVSTESAPIAMIGCEKQRFEAVLSARPTTTSRDAPSGMSIDLSVPQSLASRGLGTPPLRRAVVRLPAGLSVSASSADGLAACTLAQIKLGTNDEPTCPEAAKIGSVRIDTPLLPEPLTGDVLLAAQNDNPFRTLVALYIVARGEGVLVKLPGRIDLDQNSGQMTATFDDTPQVPFSNMHLEFKQGPRSPLAMPTACGTYPISGELTTWNEAIPPVSVSSSFVVDGPSCGPRFAPGFQAGTTDPTAGASSALTMTLTRDDGDEFLKGLEIQTPRGFTGNIASTPLCPEAQAATGTCGEESRIGTVTTGAGPGPNPFFVRGRVYFTGPYKGAPFGMSIVVPAVAGPFDLGTIAVRAAVFVDRTTAELRVISDPLPTMLQGIQLRVRAVNVLVDRPGFVINPTNCSGKRITGHVSSDAGSIAPVSSPFRATDCGELDFRPKMTFTAGKRGNLRKNRTTPVTAVLTMPPGNANIRGVNVTLPYSLNARLTVVNDACTRAEYDSGNCEDARVGTAVAETPLLRDPLTGAAYFVKREGESLPDIVVALRGQVDFDLVGKVRIPGGERLGTQFTSVPDVPISRFTLNLIHGRRGSIGTAENLCSRAGRNRRAHVRFVGQNGKTRTLQPKMRIVGCTRATTRGLRRQRRRARARRAQATAQAQAATQAARGVR